MNKIIPAIQLAFVAAVTMIMLGGNTQAQLGTPFSVADLTTVPCVVGNTGYQTAGSIGFYVCTAVNTWTRVGLVNPAATGVDINSSNQVTATHLAAALPINQGGTGITSGALPVAQGGTGIATATAGTFLVATTTNTFAAVALGLAAAQPANQTGNATTTFKMNGLAAAASPCIITPIATGRIVFNIDGLRGQTTTADGVAIKMAVGTGAAPANAAAATGSVISATQTWTALTGQLQDGFSITAVAAGLALGVAVWFDLQIAEVTAGTATVTNVTCSAWEL